MSLPPVSGNLSIRPEPACILVIVIIMVAWPSFADALSIYVNAAAYAALIVAARNQICQLQLVPDRSLAHQG